MGVVMGNFPKIGEALKYIDGHLNEPINLDMLSQKFFFSPFYFHKIFSIIVGKTLSAYIRDRRILYACKQLCTTDKAVLDIALDNGFNSAQAFSRTFSESQGLSPSEYRKQGYQPVIITVDELIMKFTNRLKGGILLNPKIIKREALLIAGTNGDSDKTTEVWNAFETLNSEKPLTNTLSKNGYEIRVCSNTYSVHVGYPV